MYNPFKPEIPGNIVGWRNPTPSEIRFGHGAIHYAEFDPELWTYFICGNKKFANPKSAKDYSIKKGIFVGIEKKTKKWIKSPFDGLRYNR